MKRLLYVGSKVVKPTDGGAVGQKNLEEMLAFLYRDKFFAIYTNEKRVWGLTKMLSYLCMMPNCASWFLKKSIAKRIRQDGIEIVFLCSSSYGLLAKYIKIAFPDVVIVTFFHNMERLYARDYLSLGKPKSWYFYLYSALGEKRAVVFSDFVLNINQRDAECMEKIYGRKSDGILPFSLKNVCDSAYIERRNAHKKNLCKYRALFVGSAFFGNTQGLDWFIESVLPQLPITLVLVGTGMDTIYRNSEKIEVHGFVDDLRAYYEETDFVILPIISGSGMKTKTAEALMYGKVIVGSDEAFCGYEIEGVQGLFCCNTVSEYKDAIEVIYRESFFDFNKNIYDFFAENYSTDVGLQNLHEIFKNCIG